MVDTSVTKDFVLLFKNALQTNDPYQQCLGELGFQSQCFPVLDFEFVNHDKLATALNQPHRYGGLIFTSRRAATTIEKVLNGENLVNGWHCLPSYVVGKATALSVSRIGLCAVGEETGNAANLADLIVKDAAKIVQPLLFLCGNIRRDVLPDKLVAAGIPFESLVVYNTLTDNDVSVNLSKLKVIPEFLVYFSPSGVCSTVDSLRALHWPMDFIKVIAMGPTTGEELTKHELKPTSILSEPTAQCLARTIRTLKTE